MHNISVKSFINNDKNSEKSIQFNLFVNLDIFIINTVDAVINYIFSMLKNIFSWQ